MAYEYGAKEPEKLKIKDMTPKQKELLIESDSFCMLPWMHLLLLIQYNAKRHRCNFLTSMLIGYQIFEKQTYTTVTKR